jgi:hypothetical protein
MSAKAIQLDLFVNEELIQERQRQEEKDKMIARSLRALFYRMNELEETVLDQQKKLERINENLYAVK